MYTRRKIEYFDDIAEECTGANIKDKNECTACIQTFKSSFPTLNDKMLQACRTAEKPIVTSPLQIRYPGKNYNLIYCYRTSYNQNFIQQLKSKIVPLYDNGLNINVIQMNSNQIKNIQKYKRISSGVSVKQNWSFGKNALHALLITRQSANSNTEKLESLKTIELSNIDNALFSAMSFIMKTLPINYQIHYVYTDIKYIPYDTDILRIQDPKLRWHIMQIGESNWNKMVDERKERNAKLESEKNAITNQLQNIVNTSILKQNITSWDDANNIMQNGLGFLKNMSYKSDDNLVEKINHILFITRNFGNSYKNQRYEYSQLISKAIILYASPQIVSKIGKSAQSKKVIIAENTDALYNLIKEFENTEKKYNFNANFTKNYLIPSGVSAYTFPASSPTII
jgi:hypothetical protein